MGATDRLADTTATDACAELRFEWRRESLLRAGYDERSSLLIALKADIDLHIATELIVRGCPLQTALRILL
jgi:hypothetical protein